MRDQMSGKGGGEGRPYVPCGSAVVTLGHVVVSLAMTSHEQHLVLRVLIGIAIQGVHIMLETLPLRLVFIAVEMVISGVCSIDETKIRRSLQFY